MRSLPILVCVLVITFEAGSIGLAQNSPGTPTQPTVNAGTNPASSAPVKVAKDWTDLIKNVLSIIGIIWIGWATLGKIVLGGITRFREHRNARSIKRQKLQGHFDKYMVDKATRNYIWPKCSSSVDPAHYDEPKKATFATRESLRDKMDAFLESGDLERYMLILADSGTGKTSFLLNYFAYNLSKWRGRREIQLIHLGSQDRDELIKGVKDPSNTVLFLDALDEDLDAIKHGHQKRIDELMEMCKEFSHVVITSRTQFFPSEDEIPKKTGVARIGPRDAGVSPDFEFIRYYISPFDDSEIKEYIRRKYPIWKIKQRRKALGIALNRIPNLCARPMLLAYLPDLLHTNKDIQTVSDLYELMIEAWLERESSWIDKSTLRKFSESLAFFIFAGRSELYGERVSRNDLNLLSAELGIKIPIQHLSSRSLLNRDAEDYFKFAHRSILEYLFVCYVRWGQVELHLNIGLTDMTRHFFAESFGIDPVWFPRVELYSNLLHLGDDGGVLSQGASRRLSFMVSLKPGGRTWFVEDEQHRWLVGVIPQSAPQTKNTVEIKTGRVLHPDIAHGSWIFFPLYDKGGLAETWVPQSNVFPFNSCQHEIIRRFAFHHANLSRVPTVVELGLEMPESSLEQFDLVQSASGRVHALLPDGFIAVGESRSDSDFALHLYGPKCWSTE